MLRLWGVETNVRFYQPNIRNTQIAVIVFSEFADLKGMILIQAKYPGDKRLVFLVMLPSGINLQLGCIIDLVSYSTQYTNGPSK